MQLCTSQLHLAIGDLLLGNAMSCLFALHSQPLVFDGLRKLRGTVRSLRALAVVGLAFVP